jgi:WD40 repeat protein
LKPGIDLHFLELLNDAEMFVDQFRKSIFRHFGWSLPLQIYSTALVFSPSSSKTRMRFWGERLSCIDMATSIHCRDEYEQTPNQHSNRVIKVVFSPDGKLLASCSRDTTIRLWDPETGACQKTLEGHTHRVTEVLFSPDDKTLASASDDKTIRLWDLATGECQQVLEGHTDWVRAVVFSPDGKTLVSALDDKTIRLWDLATGEC